MFQCARISIFVFRKNTFVINTKINDYLSTDEILWFNVVYFKQALECYKQESRNFDV